MRRIETLEDVQIVLRELLDDKSKLKRAGTDLRGNRTRNAADAAAPGDYVTLRQLEVAIGKVTVPVNSTNITRVTSPITNGAGGGGGTPTGTGGLPGGGTPTPPGTPIVNALPVPPDPLAVVGQLVIFNGITYQFTADPSAGPTGFWKQQVSSVTNFSGTHAARAGFAAASYAIGTTYYETDTTIIYMVQNPAGVHQWMYYNGVYSTVIANLPTLGLFDVNYTFQATDYLQSWIWNGTAWNFASGSASGYFVFVQAFAYLPYGVWGQTDGVTAYLITLTDATLVSVTPSNVSGRYIRR